MPGKSVQKKWSPALIKSLRGKRTQDEFARLLGAPKNTVWRWEARYAVPTATYQMRLSELAERERFFADWRPVGSLELLGDLELDAKEIAIAFSRALAGGPKRSKSGARP